MIKKACCTHKNFKRNTKLAMKKNTKDLKVHNIQLESK